MPKVRLFELLIKLRCDQLEREGAWQEVVQTRAKVIAKPEKKGLTIEDAYQSFKDRAEAQLKREDAPEWRRLAGDRFQDGEVWRFRTTPWRYVVARLQTERVMPFTEVELFEAVRLVQLENPEEVNVPIRQFIMRQDESGYTDELLVGVWMGFPIDAELLKLAKPDKPPPGGGQGGVEANIHVGNLVMGDHITAQGSTVVTHTEVKDGSKIIGHDRSAVMESNPQSWIRRLSENVATRVIATIVGFAVLGIVKWKWPWIKEFLR